MEKFYGIEPIYANLMYRKNHPRDFSDTIRITFETAFQRIQGWFPYWDCGVCGRIHNSCAAAKKCCSYWKEHHTEQREWFMDSRREVMICPVCLGTGRHGGSNQTCYACTGYGSIPRRGWFTINRRVWTTEHPGERMPCSFPNE